VGTLLSPAKPKPRSPRTRAIRSALRTPPNSPSPPAGATPAWQESTCPTPATTSGTRGESFLGIHLNATTQWKDVPELVWTYTLGGYQVLKKWLSYRESSLLGRPLTSDEAQQFTHHVRRIASILALYGELDRHYGAFTS